MRIGTLADRKEGRCSGQRINTDCGPRTTDYGPRIRRLGIESANMGPKQKYPGEKQRRKPRSIRGVWSRLHSEGASSCYAVSGWTEVSRLLVAHLSPAIGEREVVLLSHLSHGTGSCMGNPALHCFLEDKCVVIGIASYPGAFWWKACCVKHWAWQSGSARVGNFVST